MSGQPGNQSKENEKKGKGGVFIEWFDGNRLKARLKRAYQEGGFPFIFQRAKDRLFRHASAWVFSRDLQAPIPIFYSPIRASLSRDPRDRIIECMKEKNFLSEKEFKVGQENGHWFLGLIVDQEVKGMCKCGFKRVYLYDAKKIVSLPDGACFIYEYEVDEQLRRRGVGKYLLATVLRMLAEEGWRYAFCHIAPKNIASIRVCESCGFRKLEFIRFVDLVGFKWRSKEIEDVLVRAIRD